MKEFLPPLPKHCPICKKELVKIHLESWKCPSNDYVYHYTDDLHTDYVTQYYGYLDYFYIVTHTHKYTDAFSTITCGIISTDRKFGRGWDHKKVEIEPEYAEMIQEIERVIKTRCMGDV